MSTLIEGSFLYLRENSTRDFGAWRPSRRTEFQQARRKKARNKIHTTHQAEIAPDSENRPQDSRAVYSSVERLTRIFSRGQTPRKAADVDWHLGARKKFRVFGGLVFREVGNG
jgi:hypothetical protein